MNMPSAEDADRLRAAHTRLLQTLGAPGDSDADISTAQQIPVTILSGFLGAGKTTLLSRLLNQKNLTITAIVNDIASVNVDAALIKEQGAEAIALQNGCACCVLGDDLTETLNEIAVRGTRPDAIVIETSGLSDPQGFAQSIERHPAMALDGVLVLTDVRTILERLEDPQARELVCRQLDCAHMVLLTHLSPNERTDELVATLSQLAPGRAIVELTQEADPVDLALGAALKGARPAPASQRHDVAGWETHVIELSGPIDGDTLTELLQEIPPDVWRIKGTFTELPDVAMELQAVGGYWRLRASAQASDELVVIGKPGEGVHRFAGLLRDLCDA